MDFWMGKRVGGWVVLAAMGLALASVAVLSGCNGGGDGAGRSPRVQEAMVLLSKPDLSQLTEADWEQVKSALWEALGGAGTVRITSALDQQDVAFGKDGHATMMHTAATQAGLPETILVYEGSPVRYCDGREDAASIMVNEYVLSSGQWQVSAKAIPPTQVPLELAFSRITPTSVQDAGFSDDGGQRLRGLTVPFSQPGDPNATITLWVDLSDGLIRRLDSVLPGAPDYPYAFTFDYDAGAKIEVPSEPSPPDCVTAQQGG